MPPRSIDVDDFIDLFPERRCSCADFTDERDGGFWIISLCGVRFDTFFFYSSLSLYSRYRIHSKENPLDLILDDLFDLNKDELVSVMPSVSAPAASCSRSLSPWNTPRSASSRHAMIHGTSLSGTWAQPTVAGGRGR